MLTLRFASTHIPLAANTFESNPDLAAELKARGVETIVAVGVQSDHCVRATSKGAVDAGFNVVVLHGAHSTYDDSEDGRTAAEVESDIERELEGHGVQVTPWEEWTV